MSRRFLFLALLLLVLVPCAHAQAPRTWVASNGDDANPCSRTAPCRSFGIAIAKTVTGGEVDALDGGDYAPISDDANGRGSITKSITVDGGEARAGIAFAAGAGINIFVDNPAADPSAHVVLRNLRINGLGTGVTGVSIGAAKQVDLDHVFVTGTAGAGSAGIGVVVQNPIAVNIERCSIAGNENGILTNNSYYDSPARVAVKDTGIAHNGTGIRLMYFTSLAVSGSVISESTGSGVVVGTSSVAHIDRSSLTLNGAAAIDNSGTARLSASEVTYNAAAFRGTPIETHGNNAVVENVGYSIGLPKPPVRIGLQ
jgi:hypothetical protein